MVEIKNCDCLELLKRYPDGYFSAVITSPPYNMNMRVRNGKYCSRQVVKELSTKYTNYSDNLHPDEYYLWLKQVLSESLRVSDYVFFNIQQVTGNKPAVYRLLGDFYDRVKEVIIWDKMRSEPSISEGCLNSEFEFIFVLSNDAINRSFKNPKFKKGALSNIVRVGKNKGKHKYHKASFPLGIPTFILENFVDSSRPVCDPFTGLGTVAVACDDLGFDFVGSEIDPQYCEEARNRVVNAKDFLK